MINFFNLLKGYVYNKGITLVNIANIDKNGVKEGGTV